jgi:hypothetical protein
MEIQRDIAPPVAPPPVVPEKEEPRRTRTGGMSFSEALAKVEAHRDKVQIALGLSLVARLFQEIDFKRLIADPPSLMSNLPFIGIALLSYMIVLWFLAARTRDRWGFGMALGIGVLQATYAIVLLAQAFVSKTADGLTMARFGGTILTHLFLSYTAFHAGSAYPPLDSKKPWVFGFLTAFIFVTIPWVAVPLAEAVGWQIGG